MKLFSNNLHHQVQELNNLIRDYQQRLRESTSANQELESANRILNYEKRQTQTILLSISDGIIVTNTYGELLLANPKAEALLDFSAEKDRGQKVGSFIKEKDLCQVIEDMTNHQVKLKNRNFQIELSNCGREKILQVELNSVFDEEQSLTGLITVLRDVTREQEVNKLKTDFVNHVSHQLRSPLTAIRSYTELLLDNEVNEEKLKKEFLEIIGAETEHLKRLIDNFLDISRIEAGGIKLHLEQANILEVLDSSIKSLAPLIKEKDLTIEKEAELIPPFEVDKELILQVFINLISNAIKYSPKNGKVTVSLGCNDEELWFSIHDTGPGIDPAEHKKIFEEFYRSEQEVNRKMQGSGLGLALVKRIVELHKGYINVNSSLGKGATFKVTFPRRQKGDLDV